MKVQVVISNSHLAGKSDVDVSAIRTSRLLPTDPSNIAAFTKLEASRLVDWSTQQAACRRSLHVLRELEESGQRVGILQHATTPVSSPPRRALRAAARRLLADRFAVSTTPPTDRRGAEQNRGRSVTVEPTHQVEPTIKKSRSGLVAQRPSFPRHLARQRACIVPPARPSTSTQDRRTTSYRGTGPPTRSGAHAPASPPQPPPTADTPPPA